MSDTSFHCVECQEAHFSIVHDRWLKREMAVLKEMVNAEKIDKPSSNTDYPQLKQRMSRKRCTTFQV